jgi:hypothetical protein
MSQRRPECRARRREFIRTHHPDRGGDPAAFVAGLADLDCAHRHIGGGAAGRVLVYRRRRLIIRMLLAVRRRLRPGLPRVH